MLKLLVWVSMLYFSSAVADDKPLICLTGRIEVSLPAYKDMVINAANMAAQQNQAESKVKIKSYFYNNKPFAEFDAYNKIRFQLTPLMQVLIKMMSYLIIFLFLCQATVI